MTAKDGGGVILRRGKAREMSCSGEWDEVEDGQQQEEDCGGNLAFMIGPFGVGCVDDKTVRLCFRRVSRR